MTRDACDLLCLDLPVAEAIRGELPGPDELERAAGGAKALGDPTRLAMAAALRDASSLCVCDLAWITGRPEKLVSHHARALRTAGIASSQRDGKMVMYALSEHGRALVDALLPVGARA